LPGLRYMVGMWSGMNTRIRRYNHPVKTHCGRKSVVREKWWYICLAALDMLCLT
jgi:hypothetical protein